eukprot:1543907-Lingulodinium_polyedra.AAC.1
MITFDGGAHDVDGLSVSGAAAILWTRDDDQGGWTRCATQTYAFPTAIPSRAAEAWAAVAAMRLLQHPRADGNRALL